MDAAIRSVVVGGLQVGVVYHVEVAASTSAGVGVKSEPQPIVIGKTYVYKKIIIRFTDIYAFAICLFKSLQNEIKKYKETKYFSAVGSDHRKI